MVSHLLWGTDGSDTIGRPSLIMGTHAELVTTNFVMPYSVNEARYLIYVSSYAAGIVRCFMQEIYPPKCAADN